jgi:hypothetical protein
MRDLWTPRSGATRLGEGDDLLAKGISSGREDLLDLFSDLLELCKVFGDKKNKIGGKPIK